jgi:hypothetical protein
VALGQSTTAASYDGATWSAASNVFPGDNGVGVDCPAAGSCTAVSAAGDVATQLTGTWGAPAAADTPPGALTGVGCGTPTFCIAVDDLGRASRWSGASWSARVATGVGSLSSVSCAGAFCMAVGDDGEAVAYAHGAWGRPVAVDRGAALTGVSCTSDRFCAAVDASNHVLTFTGRSWSRPSTEGVPQLYVRGYNGVSCATPTFCVAVEENGHELFFGSGPAFLHQSDTYFVPLTAVACGAVTLCIAVDEEGNAVVYTSVGTHRTFKAAHVDPYRLTAVSCASASYCLAVDDHGGTVTWANGRWSPPSRAVPLGAIAAVSCAGRTACVAVDPVSVARGVARL